MGGMKFEYDENGAKFFYFIVSFYAMIIIPCTYYFWPKNEKKKEHHAEDLSNFEPCRVKTQLLNRDEPRKKSTRKLTKIILIVGWIIFIVIAYKTSQIEIEHKEYDPFAILGIDRDTADKDIRKRYRELSKTMHPDKGGDEEAFKELTKAYKALTDDEARENWAKYGNPDGPGVTQFGIALPKWIVDGKNSYLVLAAYVLVFMVIMPTLVGLWWYKSIKYTGDQLLMKTSRVYHYYILKSPEIIIKRAIMILSASFEFDKSSNSEIIERPSHNEEIPHLMKELPDIQEKSKEPPFSLAYSVRARALIHAHLLRINLNPSTLFIDKNVIIKKCPFLLNEMISIVSTIASTVNANGAPKGVHAPRLETLENVIKLSQFLVQGLFDRKALTSLLQLPHLTENQLRHFKTKKRNIATIKQFVGLSESDRRSILKNLTDEQYEDIMRVCATYPKITMDVNVKVFDDEDEQTITEGALVTVPIKLTRESLEVDFGKDELAGDDKAIGEEDGADEAAGAAKEKAPVKPPVSTRSAGKPKKKTKPAAKPKAKAAPKAAAAAAAKQQESKTEEDDESDIESESEAAQDGKMSDDEFNKDDDDDDLSASTDGESESENEDESEEPSNKTRNKKKASTTTTDKKRTTLKKKSSSASPSGGDKVETIGQESSGGNQSPSKQGGSQDQEDYFEKFQKIQKKREKLEAKTKTSHRVYCPFFPEVKQECWWVYVGDKKQQKIISQVLYICNLKDTEELELKFLAPRKPGTYTYTVYLRSDSYLEFDTSQNIKFTVHPAKKIEEHPQWNFTDEEESKHSGDEQDDEFATESENDD